MEDEDEKKQSKEDLRKEIFKSQLKSGRVYFSKLDHEELINVAVELRAENTEKDNEIAQLKFDKAVLERKLRRYEPRETDSPDYTGYRYDWPYITKMIFILSRNFGSMTTLQILAEYLKLEPNYKYNWRNPPNTLCKILSRGCKNKLLERQIIPGSSAPFYKILKPNAKC